MKRNSVNSVLIFAIFFVLFLSPQAWGVLSRIKDISDIENIRENQLIGYGLVVGLDGTGDKSGTLFTVQSTSNMLRELGVYVDPSKIRVKNVAAVMATATLPPFSRPGTRIDVTVSSVGDAKSLQGGMLLMTPLKAGNGKVYAVAQGPLSIGGFVVKGKGGGSSAQKNHVTVGKIPGGALIERDASVDFMGRNEFNLLLKDCDFATATSVVKAINEKIGLEVAHSFDGKKVKVAVPEKLREDIVELVAIIQDIPVEVDTKARVVFNERTGTVIIGEDVKLAAAAVSHGGLTIEIKSEPVVSQPAPLSTGGKTVTTNEENVKAEEKKGELIMLPEGVNISTVVNAMNAIGVNPRDMISIFQALKAAGALYAELVIL